MKLGVNFYLKKFVFYSTSRKILFPLLHLISTLFPPYFHLVSTLFPPYFHLVSTLFPPCFHLVYPCLHNVYLFTCLLVYLFTGTADEKLELIFRMYDVDNNQTLDKKEFKNMLKSMMDLVRADVDTSKLDRVSKQMLYTRKQMI